MSLQELQQEIEQQKQQQLSVDTQTEATESRRKSVHDHHPSIALLEKNENHLERRKEALMKHTGYQVDPAWWDSKLRMIKKAQAAHHKVVNSISMDHPNIEIGMLSTGLAGLRYDSDGSDEEPQPSLASHQYNVSGTEIIHGDVDPVTPRFGRDDSKTNADSEFFGLKMQETIDPLKLTDDQKEQFEAQKKQLEKVLKNFDKLLANYEHATANLEILSKIAFDKEDKKNEIKELDDKFTKEINAQNEKINRINNNVISIEESLKQMNTSQNEALTSLQSSIANIGQSIEETKKVQSTLITERNEINTTNVNASDESNKEIESKLDQLINSMNNSFTSVSNQMNNVKYILIPSFILDCIVVCVFPLFV